MLKSLVKINTSVYEQLLQDILYILDLLTDSLCLFPFLSVTLYRYSVSNSILI
jgi:hypothetical protein